MQIFAGVSVAV